MAPVKRSFPFIILQLEGRMSVNTVYVTVNVNVNKRFILLKVSAANGSDVFSHNSNSVSRW